MNTNENNSSANASIIDQFAVFWDFLHILPKMSVLLIVLALIGGGVSYFKAYKEYVPRYMASTTFTINIKHEQIIGSNGNYYNNVAAKQIAQTFPYILTSDLLHRMVEDDLGRPITGSITADVTPDTNLLTLSVVDSDPQKAYDTLNSVVKNYPVISEPIVGKVVMNVLDESGLPTESVNQKLFTKELLTGVVVGFGVGLVWSILIFIVNRTVRNEEDIRKLGIDCIGVIPKISEKKRSKKRLNYYLISDAKYKRILQEPFRLVRNKIEYDAEKENHKVFLVTSATAGEGKSLFAANLACSIAESGKKVALIDCDLRHPTGRSIFNLGGNIGLAEYLKEEISLEEYFKIVKEEHTDTLANLFFFPGGTPVADGSELLSNSRMKALLQSVTDNTDFVIIDSAPVGLLTDSAVVAKFADAAIMLIRREVARFDLITEAIEHLTISDIDIIGGVLNRG